MSGKFGVYVLASRGPKTRHGYKKEYRIAVVEPIENIELLPDYPADSTESVLNLNQVLAFFGDSRIFTDRKVAEGYAERIHEEVIKNFGLGPTHYGIVFLDKFVHVRLPKQKRPSYLPNLSAVS